MDIVLVFLLEFTVNDVKNKTYDVKNWSYDQYSS